MNNTGHQRGYTVIELMIALVLGLFLVGGVIQVYLSNKQTFRFNDALARVQETGRLAMETLAHDIRMADFWGCAAVGNGASAVNNMLDQTNADYQDYMASVGSGISGTEGGADPDSLTLAGAFGGGAQVSQVPSAQSASLQVVKPSGVSVGDIVFVSDCQSADIFQVENVNVTGNSPDETVVHNSGNPSGVAPGNSKTNMSKVYQQDAQIFQIRRNAYSIGTGINGEPTLFRAVDGAAAGLDNMLAAGVEDMQILYGEDLEPDGVADRYVAADAAGLDMDSVVSIRVSLLVRSEAENVLDEPQNVSFNGQTLPDADVADKRLRQVFTTTVGVRNRIASFTTN